MDRKIKLNPCNCGCADVKIERIPYTCEEDSLYFCHCPGCGRNGPNVWGGGVSDEADRERAAREWNTKRVVEELHKLVFGDDYA